jgi:hypothetical protein
MAKTCACKGSPGSCNARYTCSGEGPGSGYCSTCVSILQPPQTLLSLPQFTYLALRTSYADPNQTSNTHIAMMTPPSGASVPFDTRISAPATPATPTARKAYPPPGAITVPNSEQVHNQPIHLSSIPKSNLFSSAGSKLRDRLHNCSPRQHIFILDINRRHMRLQRRLKLQTSQPLQADHIIHPGAHLHVMQSQFLPYPCPSQTCILRPTA